MHQEFTAFVLAYIHTRYRGTPPEIAKVADNVIKANLAALRGSPVYEPISD